MFKLFLIFIFHLTTVLVTAVWLGVGYGLDLCDAYYLVIDMILDVNNGLWIKLLCSLVASALVPIVYLHIFKLTIVNKSLIIFKSKIMASSLFFLPYIYPNEIAKSVPFIIWPFNMLFNLDMQCMLDHYIGQESLLMGGRLEDLNNKGLLYMDGNNSSSSQEGLGPITTVQDLWFWTRANHNVVWNNQMDKNIEIAEKIKTIIENNPDDKSKSASPWTTRRAPDTIDSLISCFRGHKSPVDPGNVYTREIDQTIISLDREQETYATYHRSIDGGLRNLDRKGLLTDELSALKESRDSLAQESKKMRAHARAILVYIQKSSFPQETEPLSSGDIFKYKAALKFHKDS